MAAAATAAPAGGVETGVTGGAGGAGRRTIGPAAEGAGVAFAGTAFRLSTFPSASNSCMGMRTLLLFAVNMTPLAALLNKFWSVRSRWISVSIQSSCVRRSVSSLPRCCRFSSYSISLWVIGFSHSCTAACSSPASLLYSGAASAWRLVFCVTSSLEAPLLVEV